MLQRKPFPPRKKPMAGAKKPMARTGKLAAETPKARATRTQVQKACPLAACCVACGTNQQLTRSHILTVKMHPSQAANPLNVLTLCWPDHCIWENDKRRFRQLYPEAFALKMERMHALNPQQAALTLQKLRP
jgi:hypothetical protein